MADEKGKKEEALDRLTFMQNVYTQQYEAVMNEMTTFSMAQAALRRNLFVLDSSGQVKGSNVLVNAEGGTYIEATIKDMKSVMTYIGAGYIIDKSVDQAKEYLSKNLESSDAQMKRLTDDKQKLENELVRLQYEMERIQHS
jgi:prefoldin alpha subunit